MQENIIPTTQHSYLRRETASMPYNSDIVKQENNHQSIFVQGLNCPEFVLPLDLVIIATAAGLYTHRPEVFNGHKLVWATLSLIGATGILLTSSALLAEMFGASISYLAGIDHHENYYENFITTYTSCHVE